MRTHRRLVVLFALLAFGLQVAAAPFGPSCAHAAPAENMQQMADMNAHAHHQMSVEADESDAQPSCDMDCTCIHACQLSVLPHSFHAFQLHLQAQTDVTRPGATHVAYNHPLLRPPAQA